MRIFHNFSDINKKVKNPVVTIGNFDGVHKGHQNIFKIISSRAKEINGESVVITFEPHPVKVFTEEEKLFLLTPFKKKIKLIEKFGIDNLVVVKFSREFAELSAEEFVRNVLVDNLNCREIYVGYNYFFGKNKEGNVELLKKFGEKYNFRVEILKPFIINNQVVSSTLCRNLISRGKVKEVAKFLGRYYLIEGKVVEGKHRGNKIGFPTANIKSPNEVYPKEGVYAVKVGFKGKIFNGACSIGFNPTFYSESLTVEVYIFDFQRNIYNETLKMVFIDRIRDTMKFSSVDELVENIKNDIRVCKNILNKVKISFSHPEFI
jgi:riboflavin kinase/FMN adenylyltransferase